VLRRAAWDEASNIASCINYCTVDAEYIEATSIDPVTADAIVSTCAFILLGCFLPISRSSVLAVLNVALLLVQLQNALRYRFIFNEFSTARDKNLSFCLSIKNSYMSLLDKKDRRSIINVGRQLYKLAVIIFFRNSVL